MLKTCGLMHAIAHKSQNNGTIHTCNIIICIINIVITTNNSFIGIFLRLRL